MVEGPAADALDGVSGGGGGGAVVLDGPASVVLAELDALAAG